MSAYLLDYRHVPTGFEMAIDGVEVRAWGLWWNATLSDDPARWDDEMRALNALQHKLGTLTDGARRVRAHIAQFCRRAPRFPESVELLAREIGQLALETPIGWLGCEGRGLLKSLELEDSGRDDGWRRQARRYAEGLRRWLDLEPAETPVDRKIRSLLGEPPAQEVPLIQQLIVTLEESDLSLDLLIQSARDFCRETDRLELIEQPQPFPLRCLHCSVRSPVADCACGGRMAVESALICGGPVREEGAWAEGYRQFIQEHVLAYALAINGWLEGTPPDMTLWPEGGYLLAREDVLAIDRTIREALGPHRDAPAREWLAGCLLKTLVANQRWHDQHELIDDVPQATGWLRALAQARGEG